MKTGLGNWLVLINGLGLVLIALVVLIDAPIVRIILGFPFVLLFPGLALALAIYPKRTNPDNVSFLGICLGLSVAVSVLLGLALNYTPLRLTVESVTYSIFGFTMAASVLAWVRLRRLPPEQRRDISISMPALNIGTSGLERMATAALMVAALAACIAVVHFSTSRNAPARTTEFYVLGLKGNTEGYPRELRVGQKGNVIVGVVNNGLSTATYRIEVSANGAVNQVINGITLSQGGKWENEVGLVPPATVGRSNVEFNIFRDDGTKPMFEPLNLWLRVVP